MSKIELVEYTDGIDALSLPKKNVWLRVTGKRDLAEMKAVSALYGIHELIVEDFFNDHPAKYEYHDSYCLLIMRTFLPCENGHALSQVSFAFGPSFLLTVEAEEHPFISRYFEQLKTKNHKIEQIVYNLMDAIVDNYLFYAYAYQDKIDDLEDRVAESTEKGDLSILFDIRRDVHEFRRVARPVPDLVEKQLRPQGNFFSEDMRPYLKDLWDHATRTSAIADSLWETLTTLNTELLTVLQYKLGRTMNLMTTVSFIFLPLMVITGVYGMNFENMPELHLKYGYFTVLAVMAALGVGQLLFFRAKIKDLF